jgi:hypothetical protein
MRRIWPRQIADLFKDEDIFDAVTAVASVTRGIVDQYATGPAEARKLLEVIRELEDRFPAKVLDSDDEGLDA